MNSMVKIDQETDDYGLSAKYIHQGHLFGMLMTAVVYLPTYARLIKKLQEM